MPRRAAPTSRAKTIREFLSFDGPMRVIAHRGWSGIAPENTLPAFIRAIELGADMIELDVTLTRDGEVVVIHDETLEATSTGTGRVRTRTLAELRSMDAGSWFAPEYKGTPIPTLAEVLDLTRGRILVNIEIKPEAVDERAGRNIAEKVASLVADRGISNEVVISSFSPLALELAFAAAPDIARAVLFHPPAHGGASPAEILRRSKASAFNVSRDQATPAIVKECRAVKAPVMVYTVNDARTLRRLEDMGVRAVFTDHPNMALKMRRPA